MTDPRRLVPRTDAVLADPRLAGAVGRLGRALVKEVVTVAQAEVRAGTLAPDDVVDAVLGRLPAVPATVRPVLNATGVLVHTNLGRAPLSVAARAALLAAAGTTDVELDLDTGRRGRRGAGALAALAAAVPDARAVHVVNNGAAALVLAATALAAGREIVLARGELVEIGDGFRIPDLLESTGARLREVGTTNRVTIADYAAAVGPQTGFVLKLHPSNFVVSGFTSAVPAAELAGLDTPLVVDIGSGLLRPSAALPSEPDAATALR
ncbi:MAG TPA: L-seryl-tRNA(Sec) selenium transferase, partial [Mycobacteriales bacterium]|nr:L-seryl-tRNA(Sec) selenium transferase [Mycobacteriales bacterium]